MQVLIDAATRLVVAVGQPQAGNRNDCIAYSAPGDCRAPQSLRPAMKQAGTSIVRPAAATTAPAR